MFKLDTKDCSCFVCLVYKGHFNKKKSTNTESCQIYITWHYSSDKQTLHIHGLAHKLIREVL